MEITGVLLELKNPRARISRTETRGTIFSCLGELLWYLSGDDSLEFMRYYVKDYEPKLLGDTVPGAYGPRLFEESETGQFHYITELLRRKTTSRQAVIQLFDACDLLADVEGGPPCTCTLQFLIRGGRLDSIVNMRSNDVFLGLPHDVFAFTMLQEIMARSLGLDLGTYKHVVGSLHIYDRDEARLQQFLDEGYQDTTQSMPPMPEGDPWPAIRRLLNAEATLRAGQPITSDVLDSTDPYWADLIRLLEAFAIFRRSGDVEAIEAIGSRMASSTYRPFLEKKRSDALQRRSVTESN
jgi:thymidylate synthase